MAILAFAFCYLGIVNGASNRSKDLSIESFFCFSPTTLSSLAYAREESVVFGRARYIRKERNYGPKRP